MKVKKEIIYSQDLLNGVHPVWLQFGPKKTLENQFSVPYEEKKLLLPAGTGFQFVSLVAIV